MLYSYLLVVVIHLAAGVEKKSKEILQKVFRKRRATHVKIETEKKLFLPRSQMDIQVRVIAGRPRKERTPEEQEFVRRRLKCEARFMTSRRTRLRTPFPL